MPFPPLVISGQVISAAHINAIRNALMTWPGDVYADGFNLSGVGVLTAATINASTGVAAAYLNVAGALDGVNAYFSGTMSVDGQISSLSAVKITRGLSLLVEGDAGWTKWMYTGGAGATNLLVGVGIAASYIQSAENSTSWSTRPLSLQALGGDVHIGGGLALTNLPSSSPGAGTKMLWYDPSDGNRVKFAA